MIVYIGFGMDTPDEQPTSTPQAPEDVFISVDLMFNEETQSLQAVLSKTATNPNLSFLSLQQMLKDQNYDSFKVSPEMLRHVISRVEKQEIGIIDLATKPIYIDIKFVTDEEHRSLHAMLCETEIEKKHSQMSIQEALREQNLGAYAVNGQQLQQLLKHIEKKELGTYEIGKKPEFTQLSFHLDEETNNLYARLTLCESNLGYTGAAIQDELKKHKFDLFYFEEGAIEKLLEQIQKNERGKFIVAVRKDATVEIKISNDEMEAYIRTKPPYGGKQLTMEKVEFELKEKQIDMKSCDMSVLQQVVQQRHLDYTLFAKGCMPIDGKDTQFEALVESVVDHAPVLDALDKTDYHQVRDYINVAPNTPLMTRTPATLGKNGYDVCGKVVPAIPGKDMPFASDLSGTELDPQDSNRLIAKERGHPVILADGVRIDDVLMLEEINLKTGNINFDGSVLVSGRITAGMVVQATGDVIVKETNDNVTIIAGGNIKLDGGLIGSDIQEANQDDVAQQKYNANLTAGGNINANFISGCLVKCHGNMEVREYIAHSFVESEGKVYIGQDGGKGQLMGGKILAKKGVKLNIVGAQSCVKTNITVGFTAHLKKEYKQLKKAIHDKKEIIQQLSHVASKQSEKTPAQGADETSRQAREVFYKKINNDLLKHTNELEMLTNQFHERQLDITCAVQDGIVVQKQIYANAFFNINNAKKLFQEDVNGLSEYAFKNGEVQRIA